MSPTLMSQNKQESNQQCLGILFSNMSQKCYFPSVDTKKRSNLENTCSSAWTIHHHRIRRAYSYVSFMTMQSSLKPPYAPRTRPSISNTTRLILYPQFTGASLHTVNTSEGTSEATNNTFAGCMWPKNIHKKRAKNGKHLYPTTL